MSQSPILFACSLLVLATVYWNFDILLSACTMVFCLFKSSTSWTANDIPDLKGRVAIVTGGNTGLGYTTVLELARHGAKVYMASRTQSTADAAIAAIKSDVPFAQIEFLAFDLTSLSAARAAAKQLLEKEERLDILVLNAGVMAKPYELTVDGIELQACNGTGHFALTVPLLPLLRRTAAMPDSHVRVVTLSSEGHRAAQSPNFSDLSGLNQRCATALNRYANSKLSNILFTNELQRRLAGTGIYCLSVHPGLVATNLYRGTHASYPWLALFSFLTDYVFVSPEQGARTQLYAATALEVEEKDLKAAYLTPYAQVSTPSVRAQDKSGTLAAQFWALT
ncbi:hypothetical protein MSAN_01264800 [Mycena sanguinolenta]|uniref:NAD(P)-binding protein n=1 Tax=Mycena sanguinolenta TaxID=230812 RepID=A0A8H6YIK0_9AGAR|nr:hypothetical protein MSAN_01264800 [Mycena sanguinolenta]